MMGDAFEPAKIRKRREQFVMLPMAWFDRLKGATGQTHRVALYLLHLNWKGKGAPIKLTNGMLERDGVSRLASGGHWSIWSEGAS